jgi:hypothetical protein
VLDAGRAARSDVPAAGARVVAASAGRCVGVGVSLIGTFGLLAMAASMVPGGIRK